MTEQAPTHQSTDPIETLIVRPTKSQDLVTVADILTESFHSTTGVAGWLYPLFRLGIYEDLRVRLRSTSSHHLCLVAVASSSTHTSIYDDVVGTIEMTLRSGTAWESRPPQYPYISNLAVHQSYRRQGVARKLLLTCDRVAIDWGFSHIYLHVLENNHPARALYHKLGYEFDKADPTWSLPFFEKPQRLLLRKQLRIN